MKTWLQRLVYLKVCWGVGNGTIGIIGSVTRDVLTFGIWLKLFISAADIVIQAIVISVGICYVLFTLWFGHIYMKKKIWDIEQGITTTYNPQIMAIKKAVEKK